MPPRLSCEIPRTSWFNNKIRIEEKEVHGSLQVERELGEPQIRSNEALSSLNSIQDARMLKMAQKKRVIL